MPIKNKLETIINNFIFITDDGTEKNEYLDVVFGVSTYNLKASNTDHYKFRPKKGEPRSPSIRVKFFHNKVRIWISYSNQKLKLEGESNAIEIIDETKISDVIKCLCELFINGEFDSQLNAIKSWRSSLKSKKIASN